jgi:hypothetical protein
MPFIRRYPAWKGFNFRIARDPGAEERIRQNLALFMRVLLLRIGTADQNLLQRSALSIMRFSAKITSLTAASARMIRPFLQVTVNAVAATGSGIAPALAHYLGDGQEHPCPE